MNKTIRELTNAPTLPELAHDVTIEATYGGRGEGFGDGTDTDNWAVTLNYQERGMWGIDYHMGTGNSKPATFADGALGMSPVIGWKPTPPTAADVLYSLILDAGATEELFPEWADSLGYDSDSIKAKATYDACIENGIKVRRMLGADFAKFEEAAHSA